jgi:two-component sensor histidine kinase
VAGHTRSDDEERRLAALHGTGLLDTAPEAAFNSYVRVAAALTGAPTALISLVDADRQWFKAKVGMEAEGTPRNIAFCSVAIEQPDLLEVPDATQDPRFADNPLVTGEPGIRFYAGAPLILSTGEALGTLCVIDYEARTLTPAQRGALVDLASILIREVEVTRRAAQRRDEALSLREQKAAADDQASAAQLIARELNHRMGNLFSQVMALVAMADRESADRRELVTAIRQRVMALGEVNSLLVRNDWRGAEMAEISRVSLAPLLASEGNAQRIKWSGPQVQLNDKAAFNLALAIAELGANAARHGAMTTDRGTIDLSWTVDQGQLRLVWEERGVDELSEPLRSGFGSILLTRVAPAALMGVAERDFNPPGMRYVLTASLPPLLAEG